jgi:regulator of replication initiation timing
MNKIYLIRGQKVMIDKDLAELYDVTTGNLNKAVTRNIKRFPEDFMFQLNAEEFKNLIFHFGISSWGGTRKSPFAFTEQGAAMLSGILHSDRAIMVNIIIMRTFTKIRQMLTENTELRLAIEKLEKKTDNNTKNIEVVFQYIDELMEKKEKSESRKPMAILFPKGNHNTTIFCNQLAMINSGSYYQSILNF